MPFVRARAVTAARVAASRAGAPRQPRYLRALVLLRSIVLLSLLGTGCVIARYEEGSAVAADHIRDIVPGQTTKSQILDWFGAPQGLADAALLESFLVDRDLMPGPVVDLPFADVLVYRLTQGKLRGMILVLYNQFDIHIASDTLVVFFDGEGKVTQYGYKRGTDALP